MPSLTGVPTTAGDTGWLYCSSTPQPPAAWCQWRWGEDHCHSGRQVAYGGWLSLQQPPSPHTSLTGSHLQPGQGQASPTAPKDPPGRLWAGLPCCRALTCSMSPHQAAGASLPAGSRLWRPWVCCEGRTGSGTQNLSEVTAWGQHRSPSCWHFYFPRFQLPMVWQSVWKIPEMSKS